MTQSPSAAPRLDSWNIYEYAIANKSLLVPPICNTMISKETVVWIMLVGGPNSRADFHLNHGEEVFYQVKGDMVLHVVEGGSAVRSIPIKEGELFVLPAGIPHSPQRFADTLGIVIERQRRQHEPDGFRFYGNTTPVCSAAAPHMASAGDEPVEGCLNREDNILWQRYLNVSDLATQLAPVMNMFLQSEACRQRQRMPDDTETALPPPWTDNTVSRCPSPLSLSKIFKQDTTAPGSGWNRLFGEEFIVDLVTGTSDELQRTKLPISKVTVAWLAHVGEEAADASEHSVVGPGVPEAVKTPAVENGRSAHVAARVNGTACLSRLHDMALLREGVHSLQLVPGAALLLIYSTAF